MEKVTITVNDDGSFNVDMVGFKGKGCHKLMAEIGKGQKPLSAKNKREFYEAEKLAQQEVTRG